MNSSVRLSALSLVILLLSSCSVKQQREVKAEIKTSAGDIVIVLSDLTPLHRDNFIKLAESGFYDGVLFHRVIKDFMIQTGDDATNSQPRGLEDYVIKEEINDSLYHRRGVVAAARLGDEVNPARNSSGTQFYIVQGKQYSNEELAAIEQRIDFNRRQFLYNQALQEQRNEARNDTVAISEDEMQQNAIIKVYEITQSQGPYKMSEERKNVYRTEGGAPFLDGAYTVFGEVLEGMDVVDAIGNSPTDNSDRPLEDIRIIKVKITR